MSTEFDLVELAKQGPIHFMGIGGAGMSPLAEMALLAGARVTGCDSSPGPATQRLEERGAVVYQGHDASHAADCAALVMTAAVPDDHPELAAARARGIPVLKRAEALGAIVNHGTVVGIAGTHGKTTTTTLTTAVLAAAGVNPTGFVGARVPAWNGNLHPGGDRVYVVEADEYDRSFHQLRPNVAVVTTLEADHLDIYGSLQAIEEAFDIFAASVPDDGLIACCADDHGAARLAARLPGGPERVMTYGLNAGSMLRAEDLRLSPSGAEFTVRERGVVLGTARLNAPGEHNVRNALAAIAVGRRFGAEWDAIAKGLASYAGVDRRFEQIGEAAGILFVDDYAHHPTEVRATLGAARAGYADRRIVAVFQPHLYSRTRDFAAEFGQALAAADVVFLTDVYAAREKPIDGVTGQMIVDTATAAGVAVRYVPVRAEVVDAVAAELRGGDLCLTLGAGNLDMAARELHQRFSGARG
ncbi:UDP-N-acetylmuramate--L-alanine ligase [Longimicrobium terrae]|uniref:UDP-N-acetylmuramate--L-alanine ligase n=1 Tax=Longimicrobium terrae TaxID=1639882 RepID=A0A841H485_9BACT|nr:UDP-N-acetylmuramate--L-alanine ligase [Longimicrobium terrae]MBB4638558.1 UDP-N-acetylmuramate--alanine ligase [Longimicrobium terrae]MBB6072804.1 UDP-N-acetylmuramate--alanine ligase [Longimicrobium terrae]NNC30579.1 UDP-N-acetylmuramate--L-alanine ligase [Longimicrobium terrae]